MNIKYSNNSIRTARLSIVAGSVLLASCADSGTVTTLDARPTVDIALPQALLDSSAVATANLRPEIRFADGRSVSLTKGTVDNWSGTINVAPGRTYQTTLIWYERVDDREIPLAQLSQTLEVAADGTIIRNDSSDYDASIDSDNDGISNLQERESGSDPFGTDMGTGVNNEIGQITGAGSATSNNNGANDTMGTANGTTDLGDSSDDDDDLDDDADERGDNDFDDLENPLAAIADVIVPRIAVSDAPEIDGKGVNILGRNGELGGEWAAAVQTDNSGAPLLIDQLILDNDANESAGSNRRRWAAMHDGEYLYVLVLVDDDGDRHRDSGSNIAQDDSLELFIDGDNSKSIIYDRNDFSRIFPVQLPGRDKRAASSGEIAGPASSSARLNVSFTTGPGAGPDGSIRPQYEQDVYEIRIGIDSAGIDPDEAFGFELHVNDDDGGGERNARWAWNLRTGSADVAQQNPSVFGTLVLE